jgi:hypothetical protein
MSGTGTYEICKVPCLKFVFLANFSSSPLFLLYENATIGQVLGFPFQWWELN